MKINRKFPRLNRYESKKKKTSKEALEFYKIHDGKLIRKPLKVCYKT